MQPPESNAAPDTQAFIQEARRLYEEENQDNVLGLGSVTMLRPSRASKRSIYNDLAGRETMMGSAGISEFRKNLGMSINTNNFGINESAAFTSLADSDFNALVSMDSINTYNSADPNSVVSPSSFNGSPFSPLTGASPLDRSLPASSPNEVAGNSASSFAKMPDNNAPIFRITEGDENNDSGLQFFDMAGNKIDNSNNKAEPFLTNNNASNNNENSASDEQSASAAQNDNSINIMPPPPKPKRKQQAAKLIGAENKFI